MNSNCSSERIVFSVVVPMYNEVENIDQFYTRIIKVLEGLGKTFEIICVNDGSKDDTLFRLLALHKKDPRVKIIDLSRNFGKEIAMSAGIDFASGEAVIPIDADLQDPPEFIPKLVAKWQEGYDVVYATRTEREGESRLKKWTAHTFYRIIGRLTRFDIPKDTGDFRLMDRKAVDALCQLREHHRFMKGLFSWVGFRQASLPYRREPRFAGKTKWNYWKLWNFALEGITSFSYTPLQLATYFGLLVSVFAFIFGLFMLFRTLLYGNPVPGYPSLIVVILFLGGIQLLTIGIIGEYIGRIYNESKRRPLYFVQEAIGFASNQKNLKENPGGGFSFHEEKIFKN
ncbi:MAG TPA: glycosyltransferase [Desulfotomaculum sp.]|jgi:glycosyltransferase involved in cell wall biosynthesis|nr:glycosyltransferase [Desulfotomaculum sp.]